MRSKGRIRIFGRNTSFWGEILSVLRPDGRNYNISIKQKVNLIYDAGNTSEDTVSQRDWGVGGV